MQYDSAALTEYYRQRPLSVWVRSLAILIEFGSFALGLVWDWFWRRLQPRHQVARARQLRHKLTELGSTFIKLGQILSCRPDVIPPVYLEELANLQDQLPAFPNEIAYDIIKSELGYPWPAIYAEISDTPVAAASLGQVYKAQLKTGETVAVKVQRPGLKDIISLDIYILRRFGAWAQASIWFIRSDLVGIIDELATRLFEEMDYANEGRNAERFAALYGDDKNITAPRIYWQYSGIRVLTMEWIDGAKLTQRETMDAWGLDGDYFVELGFACSMRQLLEGGFFHADPHPGNLLATPEGKLAYLDFGMMSEVTPYYRDRLLESVIHILTGDFDSLGQDYIKLGFLPPDIDLKPLIPEFAQVFGNVLGATITEFGFKSIIEKLSPLIYKYPFRLPTYYLLIFRSFATLEGIALNINPNFQPLTNSYPYIARRFLTEPSPEFRTCLQELLLKKGQIQWHLLDDLLQNALRSDAGDVSSLLASGLDFLDSLEGAPLRRAVISELVADLETILAVNFTKITVFMGLTTEPKYDIENPQPSHPIEKILGAIAAAYSPDIKSVSTLMPLLLKPEAHRLIQEVLEAIAHRAETWVSRPES
ncbi:MAG: AarF/ABC1/UbiB kinase family protein [Oscillatoriaceae cyanobacterium]